MRASLATGLFITVLAAGTGGSALAAPSPAAPPRPAAATMVEGCLPLTDDDADDADGALVVLVDGTASSQDQPDRAAAIVDLVDTTTTDRDLIVALGSFGGSDAEVRFSCLDGDLFVPEGNNARTRERNRPDLIEGLGALVGELPAGYESSDPTSALRAGVERLADAGDHPGVLVIHTDGIPTTGCAALPDEVNLDDGGTALISQLLDACRTAGQLPAADGVTIVIGGIGRTDTDLDADAVTFLLDLNTALCEASGATCRVDPNLPIDGWPSDDGADDER